MWCSGSVTVGSFAVRLALVLVLAGLVVAAVAYLLTYGLPPVVLAGLVSG